MSSFKKLITENFIGILWGQATLKNPANASPSERLQACNLGSVGSSFGSRGLAYFYLPPRELQKIEGSKPSSTGLAITPGWPVGTQVQWLAVYSTMLLNKEACSSILEHEPTSWAASLNPISETEDPRLNPAYGFEWLTSLSRCLHTTWKTRGNICLLATYILRILSYQRSESANSIAEKDLRRYSS